MPKYVFICDSCVVEFERSLKMGEHPYHPCPQCAGEAHRVYENNSISFGFKESSSATPANTGVHKNDYPTADQVVGKDADMRWEEIRARDGVKKEAREKGSTHALIRHNNDGYIDYEPMSKGGIVARRNLAKDTLAAMRKQK